MLNLISSGRIWYLHVESDGYKWSSKSVASLARIVSASYSLYFEVVLRRVQVVCSIGVLAGFALPCSFFTFEVRKSGSG